MGLLVELRDSAFRMPAWVLVWLGVVLMPVNLAVLLFLGEPRAAVIAALVFAGLLPNVVLLVRDRRFTSVMGVPHTFAWVPLVLVILYTVLQRSDDMSATYEVYLYVLLVVNGLSLVADVTDTVRWSKGQVSVF